MFISNTGNLIRKYIYLSVFCFCFFLSPILSSYVMADILEKNKLLNSDDLDEESNVSVCLEERLIQAAPSEYLDKVNPLRSDPKNLRKGKVLYRLKAKKACKFCHGMEGLGDGSMSDLQPMPPRNFTCKKYMNNIKDGELFWVIREGIFDSGMPSYKHLSDKKIWQLIQYIRTFSS
jgi:mono/diheme cytochrome c family protein